MNITFSLTRKLGKQDKIGLQEVKELIIFAHAAITNLYVGKKNKKINKN